MSSLLCSHNHFVCVLLGKAELWEIRSIVISCCVASFTENHEIITCNFLLFIHPNSSQKEILSSFKASYSAASQRRNLPSLFCSEAT